MVESQTPGGRRGKRPAAGAEIAEKSPEELFRAGLVLLRRGQAKEAMAGFRQAAERAPGEARYRSYYGFCLATVGGNPVEGLTLCEAAAQEEFYRPELYLNLGRVLLAAGRSAQAQQTLREGLALDPRNREIIRELERMGVRKRPLFPFLERRNPLNRWPGLVRQRLARGTAASPGDSAGPRRQRGRRS